MFGIKTIFLIRIYLFNTVESYPLICPSPSQWRLRSDSFNNCNLGDHYMCLFNESSTSNTELCRKPVVYRKGLKLIWHGDIDADYCREDRFQPFNFWTNGSSTCVNIKSKCNDEGQIKYGNGTGSKDVTCICDSTKGFQFLYKPMNTIYCTPSEEDCTCFANETIQIDINKAVERPNITRLHQHNSATQRITHYVYNAGLVVTILFFIVLGIMTFILVLFWKKEIKDYKFKILQTDGEGATNETTQTDEEGATNITLQTNEEGATNETTQRDEKGATNETIQIYEDGAENETMQTYEEEIANETIKTDDKEITNETIKTDKEGATNVKNGQLRYKDSDSISETLEVETRKSNNRGTTMDGDPHVARTNRKFTNPVPCSETNSGNDNTIEVEKRNENEELYKDIVDLKVKKANKNWTISGDTSSKHQTELPEFRRRQENRRKHWLDIDTALYHETTSSKEIWKEIEKQDFVSLLIFGPQSCGKSVTAAHIGFKFEQQGYELFFLNLSNEVNERLKVSRRQVFVIDKPLGNQDIEKDLEQWEQLSKSIESTFKNNNTKFIMTLSTRLYKMFEIRLCQTMFGDKRSVVDLSNEEYNLSPDDKKHILQKHKNKGQIKDDESFDEKIMNESVLPHFLIWCNLIANKQTDDIMKEMKEETDLNDLYRKGIQALRNDFNYQYSCLILTVLFDGIFDINELSSVCLEEPCLLVEEKKRSKRMIIAILNSCGLKCDSYDINKHQKSFAELVGTYFKMYPTESEYSILNDVITKSVVRFYGPKNLNIILEYASSTFIAEFVRSVSSKDPTNASVIVVTNNYKEKFAKRLIDDLRDGKISDVFKNPSFEDHKFVSTFDKELDKLDSEQVMTLMEKIPTTSFANSSSLDVCLQFSSPVHWLCRLGLCELLDIVCKKCPQAFIKKIPGQLSPLHFAAGYGNLSVVKYLVEEMHLSTNYTPSHGLQPSPLDYAKHHKHVDVTNYLTTKEPPTTVPRLGKTFISREC